MQFKQLVTDEDAVSPVIGVILMVAITVILAAVIASFVLGLGGTEDPAPNPTLEWDVLNELDAADHEDSNDLGGTASGDPDVVEIRVTGGDSFRAGYMEIHGDIEGSPGTTVDEFEGTDNEFGLNNAKASDDDVSAGDRLYVEVDSNDWEIEFIWNPADSDPTTVADHSS